jgi:type II secretion system protein G
MNVSRAASAAFVLLYFFNYPLCYCPHYYLELSVIGLLPLVCGPRLYRYLGAAIILCGLLSAEADRRGAIRERQQIGEIRVAADIQGISTQLKLYERMNGLYPTTAQGLQALVTQPDTNPRPTRWYQLYREVPKDPWQNNYIYVCPGIKHPESYDLYSAGPDRKP